MPLFQEQAWRWRSSAAGFTPGEADQLRRAMAAWKRKGDQIYRFGQKLIDGMTGNGYAAEFAERCFEQIKGFSEYGFPESHAASFALLVYASAGLSVTTRLRSPRRCSTASRWAFTPAQLVRDAKEHGVRVLPIDVNHSLWDCTIEPDGSLRLGSRLVSGMNKREADVLHASVLPRGPSMSMLPLWRHSGIRAAAMRRLAAADAFGSMGLSRQQAPGRRGCSAMNPCRSLIA